VWSFAIKCLDSLQLKERDYLWDMDVWGMGWWEILLKQIFREYVVDWVDLALMGSCEYGRKNWY